ITFPNLGADQEIEFAQVEARHGDGSASVQIAGQNGLYVANIPASGTATISVGFEHVLPGGLELGSIRAIRLLAGGAADVIAFMNVTILVAPAVTNPPPSTPDVGA